MSNDEKDFKKLINAKNFAESVYEFCKSKNIKIYSLYNTDVELKLFRDEFKSFETTEMIAEIKEAVEHIDRLKSEIAEIEKNTLIIKKEIDQYHAIVQILKEEFEKKHY